MRAAAFGPRGKLEPPQKTFCRPRPPRLPEAAEKPSAAMDVAMHEARPPPLKQKINMINMINIINITQ